MPSRASSCAFRDRSNVPSEPTEARCGIESFIGRGCGPGMSARGSSSGSSKVTPSFRPDGWSLSPGGWWGVPAQRSKAVRRGLKDDGLVVLAKLGQRQDLQVGRVRRLEPRLLLAFGERVVPPDEDQRGSPPEDIGAVGAPVARGTRN